MLLKWFWSERISKLSLLFVKYLSFKKRLYARFLSFVAFYLAGYPSAAS